MKTIGTFVITVALIFGMVGCVDIKAITLTIASTSGGSVTTPGEGHFFYTPGGGAVVDLVASPDTGYHFVNWTGDVGTIANVSATSTTITMNSDYSITANFEHEEDRKHFFRGVLDPEGSWEYEWCYEQDVYELVIESTDRFIMNTPKEDLYWGGISGGSSYCQAFVHIYHMTEQAGANERHVIVAVWGDTSVFEAAIFPETQENRESIIKPAFNKFMEEVIQHIQAVIELSEDVIRGQTVDYQF